MGKDPRHGREILTETVDFLSRATAAEADDVKLVDDAENPLRAGPLRAWRRETAGPFRGKRERRTAADQRERTVVPRALRLITAATPTMSPPAPQSRLSATAESIAFFVTP